MTEGVRLKRLRNYADQVWFFLPSEGTVQWEGSPQGGMEWRSNDMEEKQKRRIPRNHLMLASPKIWLSKALSCRIGQRVLQLGNLQCTMQGRRCHFNDFRNVWKNELRQMHHEFPSCGNKTTCSNGMCWSYFKVSLSLHVFRFSERILQLGDFRCTMQGRWDGYDDQGQIRTHEVWKMHQENSGCRHQEDNWHRMRRRDYKVSFSIQIC